MITLPKVSSATVNNSVVKSSKKTLQTKQGTMQLQVDKVTL